MSEYSTLFHSVRGVSLQCFVDLLVWASRNIPPLSSTTWLVVYRASFVSVPSMEMTDERFLIDGNLDGRRLSLEAQEWKVEMEINTSFTEVFMTELKFSGDAIAMRRDITALKLEGILE